MSSDEPSIHFEDYKISKVDFSSESLSIPNEEFRLNTEFKQESFLTDDEETAIIELSCRIEPELDDKDQEELFEIYVKLVGFFGLEGISSESDELDDLLSINATAILFPYLRSAISSITQVANIPEPVILPTINIAKMVKESTEIE
jgi:preprotein translocase subunit SecB